MDTQSEVQQLYKTPMLCGSCCHRYYELSASPICNYSWRRCPKCGSHFAKRVWGAQSVPVEKQDSEDKAG